MKQWTLRILGVLAILALTGIAAFALYRKHEFRNIHGSSSVEFVTTQARPAATPEGVAWPRYGFDLAGTGPRVTGFDLRFDESGRSTTTRRCSSSRLRSPTEGSSCLPGTAAFSRWTRERGGFSGVATRVVAAGDRRPSGMDS
jgi:hypothetical protein